MGELGAPNVVMVKDGVDLSGYQALPVASEQGPGLVAPVRQESRWAGCDRTLADRGGLGEHPLGVELLTPTRDVADPPAHR
jgi:hypothetical protein